jgi:hypothetical protein
VASDVDVGKYMVNFFRVKHVVDPIRQTGGTTQHLRRRVRHFVEWSDRTTLILVDIHEK